MSAGHKHRIIRLRQTSPLYRLLKARLFHNRNLARVDASRWMYGPCDTHYACWTLSPLGVLHTSTGLTIEVKP